MICTKKRRRKIRVADLFCGAGGSSTGCKKALERIGLEMELWAVNHDLTAISSHELNHPQAIHRNVNLDHVHPREVVPGGDLDLLMASPECTFHSRALGGRPIHDQSRVSAWHVVRWCSELNVRALLVENVPEFVQWGPLDRDDRPIRSRRGERFLAWVNALEALGFVCEWRILNAADYGDATTRKRFFLLARSDGKPIVWPTPSHDREGRNGLPRWRAAREIIDWNLPGKSIFGRKKALSKKTLHRILAGAIKYGWPEAFIVVLRNHMDGLPIDGPLPAICAGGTHLGLAQPIVGANRNQNVPRGLDSPIPPVVTSGGIFMAQPLVLSNRTNNVAKGVDESPTPTATASAGSGGIACPVGQEFLVPQRSDQEPTRTVEQPLPAITTVARIGVVQPVAAPFVLNRHGDNGATRAHPVDGPIPTADCRGAGYLIEPRGDSFVLSQGGGGAPRETGEPIPTIPGRGAHALIRSYYGQSPCRPTTEPVPTITTKDRHALVMPVTHSDASCRARDADASPLPTITSSDRGDLAFVTAAFGERPGQTPRTRSVDEPTPSICAKGRIPLVQGELRTIDILFRMLTPRELARAMSFDDDEAQYEFCGNKTQVTRQIGNAVPVRTASALVGALMGVLVRPARVAGRARARVRK